MVFDILRTYTNELKFPASFDAVRAAVVNYPIFLRSVYIFCLFTRRSCVKNIHMVVTGSNFGSVTSNLEGFVVLPSPPRLTLG
jgi:hypothetical protein